jgi:hypothetical protein
MCFIAGLVVGSLTGFMLAWFRFSWLTAMSEGETEYYYQSGSSEDGDFADATVHEHYLQTRTDARERPQN